jgi:hypothetical protein
VVVVVAADPAGWSPFGPAKWTAVAVLGGAAIGAVLLDAGRRGRRGVARWPLVAWVAFVAVAVLAATAGEDPVYAWIGTPERRFGVLTWVLCALAFHAGQLLDDEGERRAAVVGGAVALLAAGLYSAAEWLWRAPIAVTGPDNRLGGPFGSAAYLGAACALFVPMAVGLAAGDWSWRRRWRVAAGAAAVLGTIALVGSGTRGAWLGVAVAVVLVGVARRVWNDGRDRRIVTLCLALSLGAGALLAATGAPSVLDRPGGAGGSGRLDEWRIATRSIAERPLLGAGPEGYRTVVALSMDHAYVDEHGTEVRPDRAHNVLLDVATTTGVAGVVAFLALLATVAPAVWRTLRSGPAWLVGTAAGFVAYLAQQAVLFPLAELDPFAWLLAGIVVASAPGRAHRTLPKAALLVAGAACLVVAVVSVPLGAAELAGDRAARTALRASATGDDRKALDAARTAANLRPDSVRLQLVAARVIGTTGRPDDVREAVRLTERALDWSPNDLFALEERAFHTARLAALTGDSSDRAAASAALDAFRSRDPWAPLDGLD